MPQASTRCRCDVINDQMKRGCWREWLELTRFFWVPILFEAFDTRTSKMSKSNASRSQRQASTRCSWGNSERQDMKHKLSETSLVIGELWWSANLTCDSPALHSYTALGDGNDELWFLTPMLCVSALFPGLSLYIASWNLFAKVNKTLEALWDRPRLLISALMSFPTRSRWIYMLSIILNSAQQEAKKSES